MLKMLIADDNRQIIAVLRSYAQKEHYRVVTAEDGLTAVAVFEAEKPDVILLDVMMPLMDGFAVCQEIRKKSNVPILMVTAKGEDYEKIMGLDIGADDYITKPFSPGEVMARVRAVTRRLGSADGQTPQSFSFDSLTICLEDYTVSLHGVPVPLTKKEIEILWLLAQHKNKVFTREQLLTSLWGYDYEGDSRTVDSHIKRLRAKLDGHAHPCWDIKTIWGVGYKFEVVADAKK